MKGESVHEGKVSHRQGKKSCLAWDFPLELTSAANGGAMSTGYREKECRTENFMPCKQQVSSWKNSGNTEAKSLLKSNQPNNYSHKGCWNEARLKGLFVSAEFMELKLNLLWKSWLQNQNVNIVYVNILKLANITLSNR